MAKRTRYTIWGMVIAIILIAFAMRIAQLNDYPPSTSTDEATNAIDSFRFGLLWNLPLYEDIGRPEPLYRIILGIGAALFSPRVWSMRFTTALLGVLSVAAAFRAGVAITIGQRKVVRLGAGFVAASILTVAMGHLTLSRSIYRGTLQLLFTLLYISALFRGLEKQQKRYFITAGVLLAIATHTYTSALLLPLSLPIVGLNLLVFQRARWRQWLPNLILTGVIAGILLLPVAILILQQPDVMLGRVQDVTDTQTSFGQRIQQFLMQFYYMGDENPQYNVANAPLIPPIFNLIFTIGLLGVIWHFRKAASWLIGGMFILAAMPVLLSNEITHGLRMFGEFAPIALTAAMGYVVFVAISEKIWKWRQHIYHVGLIAIFGITVVLSGATWQQYRDYWEKPEEWRLLSGYGGVQLTHNEWFFRTFRRTFAEWVIAQDEPLLIPVASMERMTTRTWLFSAYPEVRFDTPSQLPDNTRLVWPYEPKRGAFWDSERFYALLDDGVITLLPPLDNEAVAALHEKGDELTLVEEPTQAYSQVVLVGELGDFQPSYIALSPLTSPAIYGREELAIIALGGDMTLQGDEDTVSYTLLWESLQARIGHNYGLFVQLQTQDYQRLGGVDLDFWRWFNPTSAWPEGAQYPFDVTIPLERRLAPGAYRLVAGLTITGGKAVDANGGYGVESGGATISWVKVPQENIPSPTEPAHAIDATLNDLFALRYAEAEQTESDAVTITLYWEGLVTRPDIDATIFVHLEDGDGNIVGQSDIRPHNGQYPTFIWDAGEIVQTTHTIPLNSADIETLQVWVGMYTQPDFTRLQVMQNGVANADNRIEVGKLSNLLEVP